MRATDETLRDLVQEWFGIENMDIWYNICEPRYETFPGRAEAEIREREILNSGNPFVQIEDISKFFKPGTDFTVKHPTTGKIAPFKELYPDYHKDIVATGTHPHPIRVYYLANPPKHAALDLFYTWRLGKYTKSF